MRILMVSSELFPLAKVGGLADAVSALASCLASQGHDVRCAVPRYLCLDEALRGERRDREICTVHFPENPDLAGAEVHVREDGEPVPLLVVDHDLFRREGIYVDPETGVSYPDNPLRWAVFCRALHGALGYDGWSPDVVHCHDHQAALLHGLFRWGRKAPNIRTRPALVHTIHNLGYQGVVENDWMSVSGLPVSAHSPMSPLEFHGKVNLMKIGLEAADRLTTVSPTYAEEILTGEQGSGLEGVLGERSEYLTGILNGIDMEAWNPESDPYIEHHYSARRRGKKNANRTALREELSLERSDPDMPLIGMVGRLTSQKGIDLVLQVMERWLDRGLQFAILGSGEKSLETELREISSRYAGRMAVRIGFDEGLAHRIEAGSDIFLMPSRYEPCGLNQMYSLRYGTVPVVRAVGGLADTVFDYDEHPDRANGFVFRMWHPMELFKSLKRAADIWQRKREWAKLISRGMQTDFSWDRSAELYLDVYRQALDDRRAEPAG